MRAIVFNNTSRFHLGCCAVVRALHRGLEDAGYEITQSVFGNSFMFEGTKPRWDPDAYDAADLIVVNGEGSVHDSSRMARFLVDDVLARKGNKKAALVNSLWQNMRDSDRDILASLDLVCAREPMSAAEMGVPGVVVMPDLSYYDIPLISPLPAANHIKGTFYKRAFKDLALDASVNVMREDWTVIVNRLRSANALFTGKHHEAYAACIARCPFVSSNVKTHKVAGLGALIGRDLPTVPDDADETTIRAALDAAAADADGTFAMLFDKMESLRAAHVPAQMFRALA